MTDCMRPDALLLSFNQFKTLFHEFGHAINIALSKSKYQYISGARAGQDVSELPSYFCEAFLDDFSFAHKFLKDSKGKEIDSTVYNTILFVEELFRFQGLEEVIMNTRMDVQFNGGKLNDLDEL